MTARAWHRLMHLLHWNAGVVVSCTDRRGTIWMAFRCAGCGRVTHKHPAGPDPSDEMFRD